MRARAGLQSDFGPVAGVAEYGRDSVLLLRRCRRTIVLTTIS
jgi:hypothetical protein